MIQVTKEQAERTEHHPDCAGYEDCNCFDARVSYKDIYAMQQKLREAEKAMKTVNESIFSNKNIVIPMADVQHIEKMFRTCDLSDGTKKGDLYGSCVITKHTRWDMETDTWANSIWLDKDQTDRFLRAWCDYRRELESGTLKEAP